MGLREKVAEALTAHHLDPNRTDADRNDFCVCGRWTSGPMEPGWDDHLADAVMEVVEADQERRRAYTERRVELARKAEAATWERRMREAKEEADAIIAEEQTRVRELEEENTRLRDNIAERIFKEEQVLQQNILKDPTNPRLNGALSALQRARDIAKEEQ